MARVKRAVNAQKKRREVLERPAATAGSAPGCIARRRSRCSTRCNYSYRDRRARKGDFRQLWITRINAAARAERDDLQPVHPGPEGRPASRSTARCWPIWPSPTRRLRRAGRGRARGAAGRPRSGWTGGIRLAALNQPFSESVAGGSPLPASCCAAAAVGAWAYPPRGSVCCARGDAAGVVPRCSSLLGSRAARASLRTCRRGPRFTWWPTTRPLRFGDGDPPRAGRGSELARVGLAEALAAPPSGRDTGWSWCSSNRATPETPARSCGPLMRRAPTASSWPGTASTRGRASASGPPPEACCTSRSSTA